MGNSKEEILKNLLEKTLKSTLSKLEKRSKEQVKSLEMTKKQFDLFDKRIKGLVQNVILTRERKLKLKNASKSSSMVRSKTVSTIRANHANTSYLSTYSGFRTSSSMRTLKSPSNIKTQKFSIRSAYKPSSKSFNESQMKTIIHNKSKSLPHFSNSYSDTKKRKTNNISLRSKSINTRDFTNTNNNSRDKDSQLNVKILSQPKELKKEILSIQEQIKSVECSILNTEKAIDHKKNLSQASDREPSYDSLVKAVGKYGTDPVVVKSVIAFFPLKMGLEFLSNKIFSESRKEYLKFIYTERLKELNNQLSEVKEKFSENDINDVEKFNLPFKLTRGAIKAVELLDQELYNKIFYREKLEPPLSEIIIIYRIFYHLLKNKELTEIKDDNAFWLKNCEWILCESKNKIGTFLVEISKEFQFDLENVHKINHLVKNIKSKLIPSYFSKICGTTGLVVFILKDALEYCGVMINEKKTHPKKIINNLNYEISLLEHMKSFFEK